MRFAAVIGILLVTTGLLTGCSNLPGSSTAETAASAVLADARKTQLPGSQRHYTQIEIDNYYAAPDWYPDHHAPMPRLVSHGNGDKIKACASCHLASGLGHPESANLSGLPADYMVRQLKEYASRTRFEPSPMHEMAGAMTEQEMLEVSAWFAGLAPLRSSRVEEADTSDPDRAACRLSNAIPLRGALPASLRFPADGGAQCATHDQWCALKCSRLAPSCQR